MRKIKKMLALVIAAVMIVGTMSMTAFAAGETIVPEGLTADTSVTISGLDTGDEVTLFKVIEWKNNDAGTSAGWVLTEDFADDAACQAVLRAINAVTDGVYTLTKADVEAFTTVINTKGLTGTTGGAVADGASTTNVDPGMYISLVKPAVAGTLYNPIVVSADYYDSSDAPNSTSSIDASKATLGGAAGFAKKETLDVLKTQDDPQDTTDNSVDVGDTVSFTVTTTIPTYSTAYTSPSFKVTDELSTGLVLTTGTIKVYKEDGTTEIAELNVADTVVKENGTTGWTVTVPTAYIQGLAAPQPIVIKYDAVLTESAFTSVTEEVNNVKVEFSNNPNEEEDKGTVKDRTRTYTFSIDGSLLGSQNESTSELVKVAVDGNGDPIFQSSSTNTTHTNALAGAIFGLFPSEAAANAYTGKGENITTKAQGEAAGMYTNANFFGVVTTNSKGFMEINGLDEGTYYLKELKAPAGFIKDQDVHEIVISATYGTESVTETIDGREVSFDLPVLESYTITVDGTENSYSMTLEGSDITTSAIIKESNSLLNNTKGVELPSTGGMGTTIFYIIGAVLVLGAGILLVTRRRMSAN